MTPAELLRAAITASGLSVRKFAVSILWRNERTARRWLKGDEIPMVVQDGLVHFLALRPALRARIVAGLVRSASA